MEQLNIKALSEIRELIQTELKKRGIFARITEFNQVVKNGKISIEFETEEFQTQPVLFESIKVVDFGGSIKEKLLKFDEDGNEISPPRKYLEVYISVYVCGRHFSKGSTGIALFRFECRVFKSENGFFDSIAKVKVS